jgi:V/A-type H+-transporting ATPase subunit K
MKINLLGGAPAELTTPQGWSLFVAGLPIAIAGLISAIHQGKVCTAGVGLTVKRPAESAKAMVLAVFVEFYAVLGLLVTIFLVNGIKI